jgi:hypothetical protein
MLLRITSIFVSDLAASYSVFVEVLWDWFFLLIGQT